MIHVFVLLFFLIAICLGLALYFLPTIIAQQKQHRNLGGVFALNLLLGWSLLGWIGALIWALSNPQPVVIVQNGPAYLPPGYGAPPYPQQPVYPQQTPYPAQYPAPPAASEGLSYTAHPATAVTPVSNHEYGAPPEPRQGAEPFGS